MDKAKRQIHIAELLKIAWLIANEEAKHLGAKEILPIHFLLAALKIIDPIFPDQLDKLDIESKEWGDMCKEALRLRHYIDILPDKVTDKRRALRSRLCKERSGEHIKAQGMLHRSAELKRAFTDATMFIQGDMLDLQTVIASLFELELVSIDDIK